MDAEYWEDSEEYNENHYAEVRAGVKLARRLGLDWWPEPSDRYAYRVRDGEYWKKAEVSDLIDDLWAIVGGARGATLWPLGDLVTLEAAINGYVVRCPSPMMDGREVHAFEFGDTEESEAEALLSAVRAAFPVVGRRLGVVPAQGEG